MTPFMRTARCGAVLVTVATAACLIEACSDQPSTAPSPVGASTPTVVSVSVSGSAPAPGATSQFSATASLSDGTTTSVTSTATWSSSNTSVAAVNASGAVTAGAPGEADITATYQSVAGRAHVTVVRVAPATFTISGTLRDASSGGVMPNLLVQATDASTATKSATTDASGGYAISGVAPGQVTLSVTAAGYERFTQTLSVSSDTHADLVLTRSAPPPVALNLAGTWTGSGSDGLGPETFTWVLVQSGNSLSGSASMRPLSQTDGSCASCHKVKDGSISGSVSGTTVTLRMSFALGGTQPTPTCLVVMDVSASGVTSSSLSSTYNGSDSCEPAVGLGAITMTRR